MLYNLSEVCNSGYRTDKSAVLTYQHQESRPPDEQRGDAPWFNGLFQFPVITAAKLSLLK